MEIKNLSLDLCAGSKAVIKTKNEKFLFQLRDSNAPINPNKLSFFGGRKEEGETPEECLLRELNEELSIDCSKLDLKVIFLCPTPYSKDKSKWFAFFYVFNLDSESIKVVEGKGIELTIDEALSREDIATSASADLKYFKDLEIA